MNKEEIPVFRWNTETKEFYVLEHKFDGVNSIEDFINYIHNLDKENQQLKENNMSMQEEMARTWKKLDDLQQIEQEHQKINGELREENKKYKEVFDKAIKCIDYNTKYRNGADIYQFVDIESEILEPLKFILELDEENGNAYLKEFNDWLKEVE